MTMAPAHVAVMTGLIRQYCDLIEATAQTPEQLNASTFIHLLSEAIDGDKGAIAALHWHGVPIPKELI